MKIVLRISLGVMGMISLSALSATCAANTNTANSDATASSLSNRSMQHKPVITNEAEYAEVVQAENVSIEKLKNNDGASTRKLNFETKNSSINQSDEKSVTNKPNTTVSKTP